MKEVCYPQSAPRPGAESSATADERMLACRTLINNVGHEPSTNLYDPPPSTPDAVQAALDRDHIRSALDAIV
jgi:hypothetical protein